MVGTITAMTIRDHIKILGILNIALGALSALGGIIVFLIMGGLAGAIGLSAPFDRNSDAFVAAPVLAVIGLVVSIFLVCLGLPSLLGGWGLLKHRPWARVLVIVLSVLHLLNFPFGTAVGVYGLWALLGDEGQRLFSAEANVLGQRYPGAYQP